MADPFAKEMREEVMPQVVNWRITDLIENGSGLHQTADSSKDEDFATSGVEARLRKQLYRKITNEPIRRLPRQRAGFSLATEQEFQELFLSTFPPTKFIGMDMGWGNVEACCQPMTVRF